MNALLEHMIVILMQTALIPEQLSLASAEMVLKEMELRVQVRT